MLTLKGMPKKLEFANSKHIEYRKAWEKLSCAELKMLYHLEDKYSRFIVGVVVPDSFYEVMFYPVRGKPGISRTAVSIQQVYEIICDRSH